MRLVLAVFGVLVCGAGAVAFVTLTDAPAIAGGLAFLAAVAVVDMCVVIRRKRSGEPG